MAQDVALLENSATTHAVDLRRMHRSRWLTTGVTDATHLDVTQRGGGANMSVDVSAGTAWISDGATFPGLYPFINDATQNVAIATADPTNPRVDIVVARVRDTGAGDGSDAKALEVVAGTPAASPVAPATPARSFKLAEVLVAAGAASITNANITEKRVWCDGAKYGRGLIATAVCGAGVFSGTTFVQISSSPLVVTTLPGRTYKLSFVQMFSTNTSLDVVEVQLERDGAGLVAHDIPNVYPGAKHPLDTFAIDSPSAGSHTYRATVRMATGAGTGTVYAAGRILLEDVFGTTIT